MAPRWRVRRETPPNPRPVPAQGLVRRIRAGTSQRRCRASWRPAQGCCEAPPTRQGKKQRWRPRRRPPWPLPSLRARPQAARCHWLARPAPHPRRTAVPMRRTAPRIAMSPTPRRRTSTPPRVWFASAVQQPQWSHGCVALLTPSRPQRPTSHCRPQPLTSGSWRLGGCRKLSFHLRWFVLQWLDETRS